MLNKNKKFIRMQLLIAVAVSLPFFLTACKDKNKEYFFSGNIMGTTYKVIVNSSPMDNDSISNLKNGIHQALVGVDSSMSTWKPDSDLSKFNQSKADLDISLPKDILYLIDIASKVHSATYGKYDITIGALVETWGFGSKGKRDTPPSEAEIKEALLAVGMNKLKFDMHANTMSKSVDNLHVDLSSIAKGYGVDKVAQYLVANGYENFLVEVGGELRAMGKKSNGDTWKVGIEKPLKSGEVEIQEIIILDNFSIATSGNYKNYFKYGDNYYGHTLDPVTGYTARHNLLSASVFADECAIADAWATAMMALGEDKAIKVAEENNLIAYFLIKQQDGIKVEYTTAFKEKFGFTK